MCLCHRHLKGTKTWHPSIYASKVWRFGDMELLFFWSVSNLSTTLAVHYLTFFASTKIWHTKIQSSNDRFYHRKCQCTGKFLWSFVCPLQSLDALQAVCLPLLMIRSSIDRSCHMVWWWFGEVDKGNGWSIDIQVQAFTCWLLIAKLWHHWWMCWPQVLPALT